MNCHYHLEREAVGMCVECGQPMCAECKVAVKKKLYCNPCISEGKVQVFYETDSWAWWLLPILLGLIGGYWAYEWTKRRNSIKAVDYLLVGLLNTIVYIAIAVVAFYFGLHL